jgi:uncharacterized phage-like protein YoqJ
MPKAHIVITGRRPKHLGGYEENPLHRFIKNSVLKFISQYEDCLLHQGAAQGADTLAAEVAIVNEIPVATHVPFPNHTAPWSDDDKVRYDAILDASAHVMLHHPESLFTKDEVIAALNNRNIKMIDEAMSMAKVDNAQCIGLAIWDGEKRGGTWHAMSYMLNMGMQVWVIDITELTTSLYKARR